MEALDFIRKNWRPGDAVRISERSGKSDNLIRKIIAGKRTAKEWFYVHALSYLADQGRITKQEQIEIMETLKIEDL